MDPESELVITQMGLILTQLRYTRRAMEDVERSTARYGGVAFATALQAGPRFGEPPLLGGALKVYVVNINDLAPGAGFGGFLESLLGGIGRLVGGFIGGLGGGFVSTLGLFFGQLNRLASTIERILDRLGLRGIPPPARAPAAQPGTTSPAGATQGLNLTAALPEMADTVRLLTGLFTAASSGPEQAAEAAGTSPQTLAGTQWLETLDSISEILQGIWRVVDGLILLVPILIGSLATLIVRLDDIKLGIIDLLQFALRNVLLLRGVTLVTIYDTISAAASLAANLLRIIGTAVSSVLTSVFGMVGTLLQVAVEAIRFLSNGLQTTIDALLRWLLGAVGATLTFLGDTRIFRVIVHIIRAIPAIIPPLYEMIRGTPLPATQVQALQAAAARPIGEPTTAGAAVPFPSFPNVAAMLAPPAEVARLTTIMTSATTGIVQQVGGIFGSAERALGQVSSTLQESATRGEEGFTRGLAAHQANVVQRANELASALSQAQQAAAERPQTGLEAIARAYEGWLERGGLQTILNTITRHFRGTPATGPEALRSLPGQVVARAQAERSRATVEIQEVVVEIAPPAPPAPAEPAPPADCESLLDCLLEAWEERLRRGYRPGPGPALARA